LTRYFDAINGRDFDAWRATLSRQHRATDRATFLADYASTVDDEIVVRGIVDRPDGVVEVTVTFRSRQQPRHAPADLPVGCLWWRIDYPLVRQGGQLKIPVLGRSNSSYRACAAGSASPTG
jgi:hypothetical protein